MAYYALLYDYVEGVVEKRAPYRDEHLGLLRTLHEQGRLALAGAWDNPVDGAALIFTGEDDSGAQDFVRSDPYARNGLVKGWRIREWNVVVGGGG